MNTRGIRNISSGKYVTAFLALLFLAYPALCADKPKTAPSKPAAPAKSSTPAKSAGGGASASKSSSPTTASHGPTTSSTPHATTTASHPTTTGGTSTHATGGATGTHTGGSAKTASPAAGKTGSTGGGKTFGNGGGTTASAKGHTTVQTSHGSVEKRPDGHIATVHDTKRGMDVHHNLSGNRRVVVERSDHTRIVAERGGRGYVQRPYMYHGHEYARRSYYYHGHYYNNYYGRYGYHGMYLNPYFPSYYYGAAFYGWAYNPWAAPIAYGWGWGGNPWYGYYGAFFTPYPVYASPSLWLTDYIIANSLQAAYVAQAAALSNPAPLTPEVKQLIADEVRQEVALENNEAQTAAAAGGEPDAASSSIARLLTDGKLHVFVAGHDLDVVDAGGTECALSEGDAIQLTGQTAPDAQAATLAVLASKGGKECPKGDTVSVALTDLQDMQNHMRETIDQGMKELQAKQGQGGLPAAPASAKAPPVESPMAAIAPPPPPESEVAAEIKQQSQEADKAEAEAATGAASGPGPNAEAPAPEPVSIEAGMTMDQVKAALGTPVKVLSVGSKTIYSYKDTKITFKDGKVSDVQ
ncbi:MAG TPA: hypothetical protein VN924_06975 [Bryobacteraceae bacterium]|jgi:hypothetical protein|nr:hypothetical protein [Bryobacteraceae bacterium]